MRQLFAAAIVLLFVGQFQASPQDTAKCKVEGVHLCCGQCVKAVNSILKDAGIDKVNVDKGTKTVSFDAQPAACEKAVKALYDGGFAGKATINDKAFSVAAKPADIKGDEIVVKSAHVCCQQCISAVNGQFKDGKVTVKGKGAQRDIIVSGKDLTAEQVLRILNDGGFNGTIEAKK